ncbi:MAG TPA: hypothetical protein VIJ46_02585 [Rhabdochlamydiaceae bacterium]
MKLDDDHQNENPNNKGKFWSKISRKSHFGGGIGGAGLGAGPFGDTAGSPDWSPDSLARFPARRIFRRFQFVKNSMNTSPKILRFDGKIDQIKAGNARGR